MSRQYEHLDRIYCPVIVENGCAKKMCLRRKEQPDGMVGPPVAYLECYDPEDDVTAAPTVWNPVYDANVPPPSGVPAVDCAEVKSVASKAHCGWLWWLIVLGVLAAVVFAALTWAGRRHHTDTAVAAERIRERFHRAGTETAPAVGRSCWRW